MTRFRNLAALAALGASLGWTQIVALHPLATDKDQLVEEPALVGKWSYGVEITSDGKSGYKVKMDDDETTLRLVRLNGLLLGDWHSSDKNGLPVHIFLTIQMEQDEMHVSFLGSDWLAEKIQALGWPRYEKLDDSGILLTASPEELRRDLVPYFYDERAIQDEITLQRVTD